MSTLRILAAVSLITFSAGCRYVAEHTSKEAWRGAGSALMRHDEQVVPVAVLVGVTPLAFLEDQTTSGDAVEDQSLGTDTSLGDTLSLALGFAPIALGGGLAVGTGDTRYFEATAEAVLLTALETQVLKLAANRERPDGSTEDSFPSGHTSFAFGGATLLARWWADAHDGSNLGYWLYVPAAYVGASRLEGDRHYISDITFGAALGIATAHLVWNLHFGDEQDEGLYGRRLQTAVAPLVAPDRVGVSLSFAF